MKALITGVSGQDGSYLAEFLLGRGYEVFGMIRRVALDDPDTRLCRIEHIRDKITLVQGSLESYASILRAVDTVRPDECYHLAAQSFVSYSFQDEFSTMETNVNGTHYVLSAIKEIVPKCRVYFAGSSEMFGNSEHSPQNEKTPMHPRSTYGISKLAGYHLTKHYREAYGMFTSSGILFNHESPRRGGEFVTRKIAKAVARIHAGLQDKLVLGNLSAKRDWGFAGDYVRAMWAMLNTGYPDDYVVATGSMHSVKEFAEEAFGVLNLDWHKYVETDVKFFRPTELHELCGDWTKAREKLGWAPRVDFKKLVRTMVFSEKGKLERGDGAL